MFFKIDQLPTLKSGKFVALYNDGSDARLFLKCDGGDIIDAEGEHEEIAEIQNKMSLWAPVPDDFPFWFQDNLD